VLAGRSAGTASRVAGRGEGLVIGGKVILRVSPTAMRDLAGDRVAAMVSATNGKTSTTRLLATAVGQMGAVVTQETGANMTAGVLSALAFGHPRGQAVLEVDEAYLPLILPDTRPRALLLGNLTRDQLDRMNEVAMVARKWRAMLESCPDRTTVVANCDDPIVTWAVRRAPRVLWVSAGQNWTADASVCLECGGLMRFSGNDAADPAGGGRSWACSACDFARPTPAWQFVIDDGVFTAVGPDRRRYDLAGLQLPGWFNAANATLALAAATDVLGLDPRQSVRRMESVTAVSGRYEVRTIGALNVRLLLAKNPASWSELLTVMPPAPAPVIITINANDADGRDPSWLWDVPFEKLRGRTVIATGDRRRDLAVRLLHADVDHVVIEDPYASDAVLPDAARELDVIDCAATYTAFHGLRTRADARTAPETKRRKLRKATTKVVS
jgi:UDP-N-acetylmuramyl tripeptide synthase